MRIFIAGIAELLEYAQGPIPRALPASPCWHGKQVRTTVSRANGSRWRSVARRISSSFAKAAAGNIITRKRNWTRSCAASISRVTGLRRSSGLRRKLPHRRADRSRKRRPPRLRTPFTALAAGLTRRFALGPFTTLLRLRGRVGRGDVPDTTRMDSLSTSLHRAAPASLQGRALRLPALSPSDRYPS